MFEEPSRKIQRDCGKPLANECSSCAAFESLSQFKQFHALDMIAKPAECAVCIIYTDKYIYILINLSVCVVLVTNFYVAKLQNNQYSQKHCRIFIHVHRFSPNP